MNQVQIQHCAHVAVYYADKADLWRRGRTKDTLIASDWSVEQGLLFCYGAAVALDDAERALNYTKLAANESVLAGGLQ